MNRKGDDMYKDVLKKIIALTLCTCMIAGGVNWAAIHAAAEDDTTNMTEAAQETEGAAAESVQGLQGMQTDIASDETNTGEDAQTDQAVAQEAEEPVSAVQAQENTWLYSQDIFVYRVGGSSCNINETNITFASNANVDNIIYDGTEKKPSVRVMDLDSGGYLGLNTDYNVTYQNNVNAGEASVIVTGIGNCYGSKVLKFTIKPRSITNATIGKTAITDYQLPNQKYNGTTTEPTLSLNDGDTVLVQDSDYTIKTSWGSYESQGRKVTLTIEGTGNYSGSVPLSYYVEPKDITDEDVTVTCLKSVGYTGSPIEPPVSVYYNGQPLTKDTDFSVTAVDSDDWTSMGEKKVRVQGMGNYTGNVVVTYNVVGQSIKNCEMKLIDADNLVYTGKAIQPKVEITVNGITLKEKIDYTLSYENNVNASDGSTFATVTATGINNYGDTASTQFTIHQVDLRDLEEGKDKDYIVSGTKTWTYTGDPIKPSLSIVVRNNPLVEGQDYTLDYLEDDINNTTNVGTDKMVFIYGTGNYTGSIIWNFDIEKKNIGKATVTVDEWWSGLGTLPRPNVVVTDGEHVLREGIDYNIVSYTDVDQVELTEKSHGMKGIVHIEARDDGNYKGTNVGNFQICADISDTDDATKKVTADAIADKAYSGSEYKPVPKIKDLRTDKYLEENKDFTVEYPEDCINQGEKEIKVNGIGEYAGTRVMKYNIKQKSLADYDVVCEGPEVEYTGEDTFLDARNQMQVSFENKDGQKVELVYGRDFLVEKVSSGTSDYTSKGKQYVKIVAVADGEYNNYIDTKEDNTCYYTVGGKSLADKDGNPVSNLSITGITGTKVKYDNGNPVTLDESKIELWWNDEEQLVQGTDYKISYENNTEAGTATVVIKGIGNYTGTVRQNFSIVYDISTMTVEMQDQEGNVATGNELQYTGEIQTPIVVVKNNNAVLQAGTDYDIIYNNPNSKTVANGYTVTITGKGLYSGTRTESYAIIPRQLSTVTKLVIQSEKYDGQPHKYAPVYKLGDYNLKKDVDFKVISWTNEADDTDHDCINAGTILVKAEGIGNFAGEDIFTYEIITTDIADAYYVGPAEIPYDGTSHRPETLGIILEYDGTNVDPSDYTVKTCVDTGDTTSTKNSQCINAGTVTAVLKGRNNFGGEKTITYTITKQKIETGNIKLVGASEVPYNHEVQNPSIQVSDGSGTSMDPANYTCTYYKRDSAGMLTEVSECKDAGTYVIHVEGKANYQGSADLTYKITAIDINVSTVYDITYDGVEDQGYTGSAIVPPNLKVYEQKKNDVGAVKRELVAGTDYTVVGTNNVNKGKATITIKGIGNYTGEKTTSFNITAKDITEKSDGQNYDVDLTEVMSAQYTGEVLTPDLPLMQGDRKLIQGTDYKVTYVADTNRRIGVAYGTIEGMGNYTGTRTFTETDPIFKIVSRMLDEAYNRGDLRLELPTYTYDGKAKSVDKDLVVYYGTEKLEKGTDYTVEKPEDCISGGERALVINGAGNYGGTVNATFTIRPRNIMKEDLQTFIDGASMDDIITVSPYIGKEITPEVVIYDTLPGRSKTKLKQDKDYTVTYNNNKEIGMAEVVITFIGNYTAYNDYDAGTVKNTYTHEFEILPKSIQDPDVILEEIPDQGYTGSEITPLPKLTYKISNKEEVVLEKDQDYIVEYSDNNVDVGRVEVTITGINSCYGELTTTFKIVRKDLDSDGIEIAEIPDQSYTGEELTPEVVVYYSGVPLVEEQDYELTWEDNTYPGQATVTATGKGNYAKSISRTFNIRGDLEKYGAIAPIDPQCYTGDLIEPEVKVTFADKTLELGKDYKVTYKKNLGVGVAEVTVKGIGVYDGTLTANFNISKDIVEAEIGKLANKYTYTGEEITPQVTAVYKKKQLVEGKDYEVSYKNNKEVGTATVCLKGIGEYTGVCEKDFEIITRKITTCTATKMKTVTYNGTEKKPTVTLWYENKKLARNTDYKVSYERNKEPGIGKAVVTGLGNYSGTMTLDFKIKVGEPIGLKKIATTASTVKLSWKSGGTVSGYELFRSTDGKKWDKVATVNTTGCTDKDLTASTTYQYKVRAYIQNGLKKVYSDYTDVISANTIPQKPTVTLSSPRKSQAMIVWTKQSTADGYEIYQSTKKGGEYKMVRNAQGSNCTTYTKTKLTSGGTYYYKVRAYKKMKGVKVYGQYSTIQSIKVK